MRELEEKFFKTFGIEPDVSEVSYFTGNIGYPQITDRILLELICILSKTLTYVIPVYNIDELKQYVLSSCIRYCDKLQVKELFEE